MAQDLHKQREHINQHSDLMDCLQLADKGLLLIKAPELLATQALNNVRGPLAQVGQRLLDHFPSFTVILTQQNTRWRLSVGN